MERLKAMLSVTLYAIPMMFGWLILSNQPFSLANLLMGYVVGFAITLLIRANSSIEDEERPLRLATIPSQLWAVLVYTINLSWEIWMSGIDVAKRVIPREMKIQPAIHVINTFDEECNPVVAALSAHAITITPGSFVIDFDNDRFPERMFVHVLDTVSCNAEKLATDQQARLASIRRMLGIRSENLVVRAGSAAAQMPIAIPTLLNATVPVTQTLPVPEEILPSAANLI
jgi:multisubunit Na+/H+ antiporter MnhE subunit